MALELVLWALSISLVWGLNTPLKKRLKVIGLFGLRLMLVAFFTIKINQTRLINHRIIPIIAARLYFLSLTPSHLSSYAAIMAQIFTEAAMQYSLMCECMSCLKPFLQPFYAGYGLSANYGLGNRYNPSRDPYAELTDFSRSEEEDGQPKKPAKVAQREIYPEAQAMGCARESRPGQEGTRGQKHRLLRRMWRQIIRGIGQEGTRCRMMMISSC